MAQVVETVDVDVPVSVAYNQWTQFESFSEFLSVVENVVQQDETHLHWRVKIAGSTREFDSVITEQIPDDRIAWTSTGGEVDHAGVVTFHTLDETKSRVAVQIDWDPDGFIETSGAALNLPDLAVKAELNNFRNYIQGRGQAGGAWRGTVKR